MKKISHAFTSFFHRKSKDNKGDRRNENQQSTTKLEDQENDEIYVKCLVLGDNDVGKSALVTRFVSGKYDQGKKTLHDDLNITSRLIEGCKVKFAIADPEHQRYRVLTSSIFKNVNFVIICYDANDSRLREIIEPQINLAERFSNNIIFYIVRTKDDEQLFSRDPEELDDLKYERHSHREQALHYISVSSKNGNGVEELFHNIAKLHIVKEHERKRFTNHTID